ncbi:MAG: Eco57I restriction-modification methylase domain-containing protein [[Eubacterium] sulci]|nr:Eco57I restriction-modification methylase domain-containing protein [[Eubacterium] sulci]
MDDTKTKGTEVLDGIIVGRVEPHIYAFTTEEVPNYLKVGDTYRPVSKRLNEWRHAYPNLKKQYDSKAIIDEDTYFRDYSVHKYLENDLSRKRLRREELNNGVVYSNEFFKDADINDIDNAIKDIESNYISNSGKYEYYSSNNRLPQTYHYERGDAWDLRPNQKAAVDSFINAVNNGRKNLLMYAVMRFGKSFTSLCCALEISANIVLVVSAKADVKDEWKKTVEGAGNFSEYVFLESYDLASSENIIKTNRDENNKVVIFLTLQDLQGDEIKEKHAELFKEQIDLLIIDETHFGARAESFGKILEKAGYEKSDKSNINKLDDDNIDVNIAEEELKQINARIRLHLSGTPYRILMGSEFEKDDIISFVQFTDIVKEQEEWDKNNLYKDNINEWDNPYYGFPQMVRFAFNPNKSSREKMDSFKKSGVTFAFSKLFEPESIKKDAINNGHKKFKNKAEILDLLQVIDGSKEDENLLSFLDYDKIKEGKMCRHMVMVLPYCASCDAMEELLRDRKDIFKNLNEYEIINISGVDAGKIYKKPSDIKNKVKGCEDLNKKTITLTVNRMLTGSTVEQWDTMLYFKDTSSPQEYDQSIFRLQNQYIRTLSSEKGFIKENLKPQTLLVDFDPYRLFRMQEQKSLIYNVNTEENGNSKLKERIVEELKISPVITMNHNKIKEVDATNILEAISEYNNQRSISDEVLDIPVDLSILNDEDIRKIMERQGEFNSKQGLSIDPYKGSGDDLDLNEHEDDEFKDGSHNVKDKTEDYTKKINDNEIKKLENKIKTYYQRLLFFAFLVKDKVASLDDIIKVMDSNENQRLVINLNLDKKTIVNISEKMDPFKRSGLDYKIQNISMLASDERLTPLDRAMTSIKKFNRMSESEVITPSKVCDEMVALLPEEGLRKIVDNQDKFLDIASKSGEYAVSIYKRLTLELGYSHEDVKNTIYSVPTSSIAYEFTRRFYEILNLNVDNIASGFNAYDLNELQDKNGEVDYIKINDVLKQDIAFNELKLKDEIKVGENRVKFGAVIGNPPYQISDGGAQASAKPIYQNFVLIGKKLASDYTCFITPTRWFAGGKGLDEFRNQMLNDKTIKELHDFLTPEDVFPNTNNRGGVCYFINDENKTDLEVKVVTHKDNQVISEVRRILLIKGVDLFIRDSIAIQIIKKIFNDCYDKNFSSMVSSRKPFGIESNIIKTDIFKQGSAELLEPVICIGKNKCKGFIEKEHIKSHKEWIDKWKVYVPRANNIGTELNDDNLNSFIGEPNSVCTEAYIVVGAGKINDKSSAMNVSKYLTTKFVRFLHRQAKASQDASSKTYKFIPIENFTNESDIDWSKSINEIDEQLFNKYGLSIEEREHIKSSIKDM